MKGFLSFLGKPRARNIAVVDISSASVGAAFATSSGVAPPAIVFSSRVENKSESVAAHGMLRALDMVAKEMVEKGAPKLRNVSGRGSVDEVLVQISAPWQTSTLEVKVIDKDKPFLFTEAFLSEALSESRKRYGSTQLIASVLNGYETPTPIGKKATRAEMVLLSTHIDPEVEPYIRRAIHSFVGAVPIHTASFSSAAHLVLRGLFPHERDFLALRVGTDVTELTFVKQTHIAGIETAAVGTKIFTMAAREQGIEPAGAVPGELIDKDKSVRLAKRLAETESQWIGAMRDALMKIAAEGALPRAIFLFADERALPFFKRLLDSPELHNLWLSDEPLSVIPVGPRHFYQFMRHIEQGEDDAVLDMLALVSRVS